jgi:hypothetical protein
MTYAHPIYLLALIIFLGLSNESVLSVDVIRQDRGTEALRDKAQDAPTARKTGGAELALVTLSSITYATGRNRLDIVAWLGGSERKHPTARTKQASYKPSPGHRSETGKRYRDKLDRRNDSASETNRYSPKHRFDRIRDRSSDTSYNASWTSIPMPKKSYYAGFDPPNNLTRWQIALDQASRGEQVLLSKVFQVIRSPFDFIPGTKNFKWVHELAEFRKSKADGYLNDMVKLRRPTAPITMLGYRKFDVGPFEGNMIGLSSMNPDDIRKAKNFKIPRKIVGVGNMDENWGYLSTYFLNRTVPWGLTLAKKGNPFDEGFQYCDDYMKPILDDPNLVMLVVNQHHNCSSSKVISLPLGINDLRSMWNAITEANRLGLKKSQLFFSAGSNYAFRPFIRECMKLRMGDEMVVEKKMSAKTFRMKVISSIAVLCMPGLGYDTYRLWETLASGSLPVLERGFGMDRTFYKLPVLLLDDFSDLDPFLLKQAYAEALYRADDWEYERMTKQYWQRLIYEVSEAASIEPLLKKHPAVTGLDNFTRPLVPYDCSSIGGCGSSTKTTPTRYCAIDPAVMNPKYKWVWNHAIGDN